MNDMGIGMGMHEHNDMTIQALHSENGTVYRNSFSSHFNKSTCNKMSTLCAYSIQMPNGALTDTIALANGWGWGWREGVKSYRWQWQMDVRGGGGWRGVPISICLWQGCATIRLFLFRFYTVNIFFSFAVVVVVAFTAFCANEHIFELFTIIIWWQFI